MGLLIVGIAAAAVASCMYNLAVALQALEARTIASESGFRLSLLTQLLRRVRWVAGIVLGVLAWPAQMAALLLAPLTVVQPTLAAGLFLLLAIGTTFLGEKVRQRDVIAVIAIVVGVAGLASVAPEHSSMHAGPNVLTPALAALGAAALFPLLFSFTRHRARSAGFLAATGAGLCYAWSSLSTKFITDDLGAGHWLVILGWGAATAIAAGIGLLSETTALQTRPASRVAPLIFVVQTVVPVVAAPLLAGERWPRAPLSLALLFGALIVVLAGSAALTSSTTLTALSATDATSR